jgi:hypothetical protein
MMKDRRQAPSHVPGARILVPLLAAFTLLLPACRDSPSAPAAPALSIATDALPPATRGQPYAEALHGMGGDGAYQWDIVSGALPAGLALVVDDLSIDDALITGTPQQVESATFTVRLRSGDGQTVSRPYTLAVVPEPGPLSLQPPRLPPALAGAPYGVPLRADGGDGQQFTWAITDGRLPTGLTLNPAGRIEGTPVAVESTTFTLEVRSGGLAVQRVYELRAVPHDADAFRVTIFPVTDIPPGLQAHVGAAVARIESAVTGNLPVVAIPPTFFGAGHCSGFGSLVNGTAVDDVLIVLNIMPIDGRGRVLGRAGPCGTRERGSLPFVGVMVLDVDDLIPLMGTETLTDILIHEMAHVLGFGALWAHAGLIQGAGTDDPRFTGQRAVAEYGQLGGSGAVPLETQGGQGTAESHWRKTTFHVELMTGFAEPVGVDQPMSRVTIGSFADLGYSVNMAAADRFVLGAGLMAGQPGESGWRDALGHDHVYRGPILVLPSHGQAGPARELRP